MQTIRLSLRNLATRVICLAALTMFSSCEKDNEKTTDKEIVTVKAEMGNFEIVSSVKYENNELELDELSFPTTIPDNYLTQVVERAGVVVSDAQAKIGEVWVTAYNSAGERIGSFSKFSNDSYPLNLELITYMPTEVLLEKEKVPKLDNLNLLQKLIVLLRKVGTLCIIY